MADAMDHDLTIRLASEIVIAYLAQRPLEAHEVPQMLIAIREALQRDCSAGTEAARSVAQAATERPAARAVEERPTPAVPVEDSITPDFLLSLEDGQPYRSLRRHLMARYGLTPDAYRKKWSLPPDYPMVAPNYARDRSEVAKRIGLGRTPKAKPSHGRSNS